LQRGPKLARPRAQQRNKDNIQATMNQSTLPHNVISHQDVALLHAAARRVATRCGNGKVVWRIWGEEGRAVVLLHGGSGSWTHWVRNIGELTRRGYRVYVPDLP